MTQNDSTHVIRQSSFTATRGVRLMQYTVFVSLHVLLYSREITSEKETFSSVKKCTDNCKWLDNDRMDKNK